MDQNMNTNWINGCPGVGVVDKKVTPYDTLACFDIDNNYANNI